MALPETLCSVITKLRRLPVVYILNLVVKSHHLIVDLHHVNFILAVLTCVDLSISKATTRGKI